MIGTCGGAAKVAALEALGVDHIIDHTCEDVGEVLQAEYPNGVDLIYEGRYLLPLRPARLCLLQHLPSGDKRNVCPFCAPQAEGVLTNSAGRLCCVLERRSCAGLGGMASHLPAPPVT